MSSIHTPKEIRDHLIAVMSSEWFLKMQGLNNDIPFFICDYDPKYTVDIESGSSCVIAQVINSLSKKQVSVLNVNLFDLSIDLIKVRGIWERVIEKEDSLNKEQFKELIQGVVDTRDHLIPAISKTINANEHDVLLLTGVAEVFPFIRPDSVLNNLQNIAKTRPSLMMFPGRYHLSSDTGGDLILFGKVVHKYYRALNILEKKA